MNNWNIHAKGYSSAYLCLAGTLGAKQPNRRKSFCFIFVGVNKHLLDLIYGRFISDKISKHLFWIDDGFVFVQDVGKNRFKKVNHRISLGVFIS
jgi:hypothetical protein